MTENKEPSINFETFVLSLGTATFVALGEIENPVSGKKEENLDSAKHNIDILDVLVEKTKGNLNEREDKLLSDVLYQARMRYVERRNSQKKDS